MCPSQRAMLHAEVVCCGYSARTCVVAVSLRQPVVSFTTTFGRSNIMLCTALLGVAAAEAAAHGTRRARAPMRRSKPVNTRVGVSVVVAPRKGLRNVSAPLCQ
jgi:hypothetical protein